MKKVWSILLAVLMLVSALPLGAFSVVVGADDAPTAPTIWADHVGGYAGDTVTVAVQMANNPGLAGWLVDVAFDEAALELTAQAGGDAFAGIGSMSFNKVANQSPTNGLWYEFLSGNNYTNNGVLFTLTFKIKDNAPGGTYPITVYCSDPDNMCNKDFECVEFDMINGSVEVYEHVAGVALDPAALNLKNGETAALTPVFTPETAYNKNVSWASDNTAVATVAEDGTVTAIKRGTATITVTTEDGGYTATATVNVTCANLVHYAAVAPDHYNTGNVEYWHCENCGGYFTDAAGTVEVSAEDIVVDVIPHSYSDAWTYDDATHWNACSCGAKNNETAHIYDNACDTTCVCGYVRAAVPHVFDGLADGYCNECGATRVVTKFELTTPYTRVYAMGNDTLDLTGGYVDVAYADGAEGRVDLADAIITGYDSAVSGMQTLTVIVGSGSATYTVQVVEGDLPTIRVEVAQKAFIGKEITATVYLDNNPGLISLKLAIDYDTSKLELIKAEAGEGFAGEDMFYGPLTAPFNANWINALNPNNTNSGVFVTLTFKVKDDAVEGPTPITVRYDDDDLFNYDFEPVLFNTVNAETEVRKCLPGDLNNDGKINIRDLGLLQQHLNGWNVTFEESAADLNGDGKLNIRDLGLLQQYLNGWDIEFK